MANSKGKTLAEQEYTKELNRIKKFIKKAEERGYKFDNDIIPDQPKRITKKSVRRLQELKPTELYKRATAVSEVTGKVISGTERRKEERSTASMKGAKTRAKASAKAGASTSFINARIEKDKREKDRLETDEDFRSRFSEGEIIYNRILEMIANVERDHKKAGEHLASVLNHELSTYGKDHVMMQLAQSPEDAVMLADIALRYNPGYPAHDDAIREFDMLIRGSIPTSEEARDLQDSIDQDTYVDTE